jgi:hypothetical protein
MRADQQPAALVAGNANQQLGIIRVLDIRAEHRVVGGFLAQLVSFASKHPHQRIEPEQSDRDP